MPLWESIFKNDIQLAQKNITTSTELNKTNDIEITPLMLALSKKRTTIAKLLIEAGADINHLDKKSQNALFYVSSLNQAKIL